MIIDYNVQLMYCHVLLRALNTLSQAVLFLVYSLRMHIWTEKVG